MPEQKFHAMIEELASDHVAYAKVDLTNQVKMLHNTIEDMMMRLEEFESIFGMVQTEGAECLSGQIPRLQIARQELTGLCRRIDALEHVVARANVNLVSLEAAVDAAESDLGVPDSLFTKLNPLSFFKKAQEPVACTRTPAFDPPIIYRTEEFFNPESRASLRCARFNLSFLLSGDATAGYTMTPSCTFARTTSRAAARPPTPLIPNSRVRTAAGSYRKKNG